MKLLIAEYYILCNQIAPPEALRKIMGGCSIFFEVFNRASRNKMCGFMLVYLYLALCVLVYLCFMDGYSPILDHSSAAAAAYWAIFRGFGTCFTQKRILRLDV